MAPQGGTDLWDGRHGTGQTDRGRVGRGELPQKRGRDLEGVAKTPETNMYIIYIYIYIHIEREMYCTNACTYAYTSTCTST